MPDLDRVIRRFALDNPGSATPFTATGNIHDAAYVVPARDGRYLLQPLNRTVFHDVDALMATALAWTEAELRALSRGAHPSPLWTPLQFVPTRDGAWWTEVDGQAWRMMRLIEGARSYRNLAEAPAERRRAMSIAVGRGLALVAALGEEVDATTWTSPLPGYRDPHAYLRQLEALSNREEPSPGPQAWLYRSRLSEAQLRARLADPRVQEALVYLEDRRDATTWLADGVRSGALPRGPIHGDPKLENFLFEEETGEIVALIDLDTAMPYTWLSDVGDALRSLANPVGEVPERLEDVTLDEGVVEAVAEGLAVPWLPARPDDSEVRRALLAQTLEQAVRFLADYLRGDAYYRLAPGQPADLNLTRALVQVRLAQAAERL